MSGWRHVTCEMISNFDCIATTVSILRIVPRNGFNARSKQAEVLWLLIMLGRWRYLTLLPTWWPFKPSSITLTVGNVGSQMPYRQDLHNPVTCGQRESTQNQGDTTQQTYMVPEKGHHHNPHWPCASWKCWPHPETLLCLPYFLLLRWSLRLHAAGRKCIYGLRVDHLKIFIAAASWWSAMPASTSSSRTALSMFIQASATILPTSDRFPPSPISSDCPSRGGLANISRTLWCDMHSIAC